MLHTQMQKELGGENGAFPVVHWLGHAETVVRLGVIPEGPTLATGWFGRALRPDHKIVVDHATGRVFARDTKWQGVTEAQPVPQQPAPADLLVKAREYYPNDEGLLRLYAEMRGYSCQQVEEAIDHAKRL